MGEGGEKLPRGELSPEQQAERFSTGGLDFEESLRRVLVGGRGDESDEGAPEMGEQAALADRELTDEQLLSIWERTTAGVRDGSIPTFSDARSLREDIRRRLNM